MLTIVPRDAVATHQLDALLHQEEGATDIDGEDPVEQLRRGVEDGAAIGIAGRVHERVDPAEDPVRLRHDPTAGVHILKLRLSEDRAGAGLFGDPRRDRLAALAAAPRDDEAGGMARREFACDGRAQPLRRPRDDGDLARHIKHSVCSRFLERTFLFFGLARKLEMQRGIQLLRSAGHAPQGDGCLGYARVAQNGVITLRPGVVCLTFIVLYGRSFD